MRTFWPEGELPPGMGRAAERPRERSPLSPTWNDFRPWGCERCCQLAWDRLILYGFSLLLKGRADIEAWMDVAWHRCNHEQIRHLIRERHVFALLPPAGEGVRQA